ncbi:MAG: S41 family peptidase [Candidatus Paceibacterota bacterium]|jgi:carboxyl-terminal processing protease
MIKLKHFVLFFLGILLVAGGFGGGVWFEKSQTVCPVCALEHVNLSLFWETWEKLESEYVDRGGLDIQSMIYGAIEGMVNSLEDPYTVFMTPEDTQIFLEDVSGSFEGVGMEIDVKDNQLQVISPLEGTPAQAVGLMPGDKIMTIDGESTAGITTNGAVKKIRGEAGTQVVLGIYRDNWKETRDIAITREVIVIPSLKLELRNDGIAYIQLYQFSEAAFYGFREAAMDILNSDADRIILDLRNNPGGYLEVAQDIAGWFIDRGDTVVIEDFGDRQETYESNGNANLKPYPIVILINEGSASASEILAGALKDVNGSALIGATSFGKGSVQILETLSGETSLKVTVAKWLTPAGEMIHGVGLEPDIKVEMTEEDVKAGRDPQLDKAIEIIKGMN